MLSATIAAVSAPAIARADGYISPFAGTNFGSDAANGRVHVGVDAGWMGAGIIGGELDFGYAPNFFGDGGEFGSNSVIDLMGNLIVGVPAGGQNGAGIRPYATIGAGMLRLRAGDLSETKLGMNGGVGIMGFLSDHLGIRADVRYFRDLTGNDSDSSTDLVDFGGFHFWRASVGIVFRP